MFFRQRCESPGRDQLWREDQMAGIILNDLVRLINFSIIKIRGKIILLSEGSSV